MSASNFDFRRQRNHFDKDSETLNSVPIVQPFYFDNKAMTVQQLTLPGKRNEFPIDNGTDAVERDIKVIALVKGEEQYIFLYNENNRAETLRLLGRYASNPELSFSWYDAAVLSQKIRQDSLQKTREKQQRAESPRRGVSVPLDDLF